MSCQCARVTLARVHARHSIAKSLAVEPPFETRYIPKLRSGGERGYNRGAQQPVLGLQTHRPAYSEREIEKRGGEKSCPFRRYILITRYKKKERDTYANTQSVPPFPSRGNLLIVDQDYTLEPQRGDNVPIEHTRRFGFRFCTRACTCDRIPKLSGRAWRTWLFAIANPILFSLPPLCTLSLSTRGSTSCGVGVVSSSNSTIVDLCR